MNDDLLMRWLTRVHKGVERKLVLGWYFRRWLHASSGCGYPKGMKTSGCWKVLGGQLVPAFYQYLPLFKASKHARQEGGPPVDQHLLSRTPGPKNTLAASWSPLLMGIEELVRPSHRLVWGSGQTKLLIRTREARASAQRELSSRCFGNSRGQALTLGGPAGKASSPAAFISERHQPYNPREMIRGRLPYLKLRMSAPAPMAGAAEEHLASQDWLNSAPQKYSKKRFFVAFGIVSRSVRTLKSWGTRWLQGTCEPCSQLPLALSLFWLRFSEIKTRQCDTCVFSTWTPDQTWEKDRKGKTASGTNWEIDTRWGSLMSSRPRNSRSSPLPIQTNGCQWMSSPHRATLAKKVDTVDIANKIKALRVPWMIAKAIAKCLYLLGLWQSQPRSRVLQVNPSVQSGSPVRKIPKDSYSMRALYALLVPPLKVWSWKDTIPAHLLLAGNCLSSNHSNHEYIWRIGITYRDISSMFSKYMNKYEK